MNFFCCKEHLQAWEREKGIKEDEVGIFDDLAVIKLRKLIYNTKGELDYKRPTEEEERNPFIELNLVGSIWDNF